MATEHHAIAPEARRAGLWPSIADAAACLRPPEPSDAGERSAGGTDDGGPESGGGTPGGPSGPPSAVDSET